MEPNQPDKNTEFSNADKLDLLSKFFIFIVMLGILVYICYGASNNLLTVESIIYIFLIIFVAIFQHLLIQTIIDIYSMIRKQ